MKLEIIILLACVAFAGNAESGDGGTAKAKKHKRVKPLLKDTTSATVYADNWFKLYVNGTLVAVDSISFIPHNVVSVDLLPEYPMTIAVIAKDNADPQSGMEYDNTQIGDGGFILKFSDGTVTDQGWRVKVLSHGPIDGNVKTPSVRNSPAPSGWMNSDFDDKDWPKATVHSEKDVGPKRCFYEHDFAGAKFIWSRDLKLDNTVLFRRTIPKPPNGTVPTPSWPRGHIDADNRRNGQ